MRGCGKNGKNAEWLNMYMFGFNICCGGGIKLSFQTCLQVLNQKRHICERNVGRSGQLATYCRRLGRRQQLLQQISKFTASWTLCEDFSDLVFQIWIHFSILFLMPKRNWMEVKLNHRRRKMKNKHRKESIPEHFGETWSLSNVIEL